MKVVFAPFGLYLDDVRQARNEARGYLINRAIITPEEQRKWYEEVYTENPEHCVIPLLDEEDREFVGYVQFTVDEDEVEVGIVIKADKRRRGFGEEGMRTLIELIRSEGDKKIVLEVLNRNKAAIALYEKLGFRTVNRRLVEIKGVELPLPGKSMEVVRDMVYEG